MGARLLLLAALLLAQPSERAAERDLMVLSLENLAATAGTGSVDRDVLRAMRKVPRHRLVPEEVRKQAYQNIPLPIG